MIVFLDFDGVTHSETSSTEPLFGRLPLIEAVLREFETVRIVISSSWRVHHSLDVMREFFSLDMAQRVIDVTPIMEEDGGDGGVVIVPDRFERQQECEAWLEKNRPRGTSWLAIDDWPYGFEPQCPHLLLTDPDQGFAPDDAPRLREMIEERL